VFDCGLDKSKVPTAGASVVDRLMLSRASRSQRGQIELFAAILVVGTIGVAGYAFLLVDTGLSAYYKEKLQYVAQQGAAYAANCKDKDVNSATQKVVSAMCEQMNLQVSDLIVDASSGQPASCKVSASFPIIQGSVLPARISLSDVETSLGSSGSASIIKLAIVGNGNTFYDPGGSLGGSVLGNGNKVVVGPSTPNNGSGNGSSLGTGNTNTGSGNVIGNGNNNSGSGNVVGNGNSNSGSGNIVGNGNDGSGTGPVIGNGNSNSTDMSVIGNGNSVK
jgi:hypothetical protein